MISKNSHIVLLLFTVTLFACQANENIVDEPDPYGIFEAAQTGGTNENLLSCSSDPKCPEYAEALFWVAADILSEASAEKIDLKASDLGINVYMSPEQMLDKLQPFLNEVLEPETPDYTQNQQLFWKGYDMMFQSYQAGNAYAAVELGVLHFEQENLKNLVSAETFFKIALERGDAMSAYNLERLYHQKDPNNSEAVISNLKLASDELGGSYIYMYVYGLEAFGNDIEKQVAPVMLSDLGGRNVSLFNEFKFHFGLQ